MYELLQEKLAEHGEVMAIMASGEEVELHLGNTMFDDPKAGTFRVEGSGPGGREVRIYDGGEIESVRLHWDL